MFPLLRRFPLVGFCLQREREGERESSTDSLHFAMIMDEAAKDLVTQLRNVYSYVSHPIVLHTEWLREMIMEFFFYEGRI